MGLSSFGDFQRLLKQGYVPKRIGFPKDITAGDINRLNARVRLARDFETIHVKDLGLETTKGYEVLLRVFLTHSALEIFLTTHGYTLHSIGAKLARFNSDDVLERVRKYDSDRKLYPDLHPALHPSVGVHRLRVHRTSRSGPGKGRA